MPDLRALIVTERYPPYHVGGYETACHSVVEELRSGGVAIRVLTSDFGLRRPERQGHVWRVLHRPQASSALLGLALGEVTDHRLVRSVVREFRPDVIYAWCLQHLFATLHDRLQNTGIPVVFNIQDVWVSRHVTQAGEIRSAWQAPSRGVIRTAAKRAAAIVCRRWVPSLRQTPGGNHHAALRRAVFCSRFRQEQHRDAGFDVDGSQVIYNGVDLERFRMRPRRESRAPLRLLVAGRIVTEKGVHTAVDAVAEINRHAPQAVTLTIAGPDAFPYDYPDAVRRAVADGGLDRQVSFAGMVSDSDMPRLYHEHDVLLFPSTGPEGFPMSVIEAMASGTVVVGTTTGGTGEVLAHGETGLVFSPGSASDLAGQVLRLLGEPSLPASLATAARRIVESRFTAEHAARQSYDHLSSVVVGSRRERASCAS